MPPFTENPKRVIFVEQHLSVPDEDFTSIEMQRFLQIIEERDCRYYASDFFPGSSDQNIHAIDECVQHAFEVFKKLHIPTENHFQMVLRVTVQRDVFMDWKISEMACLYMFMNGDPEDLQAIAEQQHLLIRKLLQYLRELKTSSIKR